MWFVGLQRTWHWHCVLSQVLELAMNGVCGCTEIYNRHCLQGGGVAEFPMCHTCGSQTAVFQGLRPLDNSTRI